MMTQRFENAVDQLIEAFFNETLTKGKCDRCAVGNICGSGEWAHLFMTEDHNGLQSRNGLNMSKKFPEMYKDSLDVVYETGYSPEELAKVESVFERNTAITYSDYMRGHKTDDDEYTHEEFIQDQFNGLCAVIDVLCEFEGQDPEVYKNKLREKPEVEV